MQNGTALIKWSLVTTPLETDLAISRVASCDYPLAFADFPEDRFPPLAAHREDYQRKVALGYAVMRQRRVVLTGLARDVAAVLPKTIFHIEKLAACFADYHVVIYENDSLDATRKILFDWSRRNRKTTILSERLHDPPSLSIRCLRRARRMASYRNRCQEAIRRHLSHFDDVIVVDTDLPGGWSCHGVANTYGHDGWHFVGSNGIAYRRRWWRPNSTLQYDAWAFRDESGYEPLKTKVVHRMQLTRGAPLIPVRSCFGGIGVYHMEAFLAGVYDSNDCEHVGFHRSMRHAGFHRQFLNPSQITLYGRIRRKMDGAIRWCQSLPAAAGCPVSSWLD